MVLSKVRSRQMPDLGTPGWELRTGRLQQKMSQAKGWKWRSCSDSVLGTDQLPSDGPGLDHDLYGVGHLFPLISTFDKAHNCHNKVASFRRRPEKSGAEAPDLYLLPLVNARRTSRKRCKLALDDGMGRLVQYSSRKQKEAHPPLSKRACLFAPFRVFFHKRGSGFPVVADGTT